MTPTERLAARMKELGLTPTSLARLVGKQRQQIHPLTTGRRPITLAWAQILAPALGISWLDLIETKPATGMKDHSAAFGPAPASVILPTITAIEPEEEDGFDDMLAAADVMLKDEGALLTPREFARLARELWREIEDEGAGTPLSDRIASAVERRRTMIRAARRLAVGRWKHPGPS